MQRKLWMVIAGGAVAGAASALIAFTAFADHSTTASGGDQPSTLLESANGSGGPVVTAPADPAQSGSYGQGAQAGQGAQSGVSGTVAGRSQASDGGVAARGVAPATPRAVAPGSSVSLQLNGALPGLGLPASPPAATTQQSTGTTSSTSAAGASSSSSSASSTSSSSSQSSSSATSSSTSTSTSTSSSTSGLLCTVLNHLLHLC